MTQLPCALIPTVAKTSFQICSDNGIIALSAFPIHIATDDKLVLCERAIPRSCFFCGISLTRPSLVLLPRRCGDQAVV